MKTLILAISIAVLLKPGEPAAARARAAVMVIAGNLSIRDIVRPDLPTFSRLLNGGGSALVNLRTGRPSRDTEPTEVPGMEAACASIGAGAMAVGGAEVRRASDRTGPIDGVPAAALYEWRTGRSPGKAAVIHAGIVRMRKVNAAASYAARPGSLGTALRAAGIRTAVLGNSDLPGELHREVTAAVMDENGLVDLGSVDPGKFLQRDSSSPFGLRTNIERLTSEFDRIAASAQFIVVDFGDTFRADRYAELSTGVLGTAIRREAVVRLDHFLAKLIGRLDPDRDLLIVFSPTPPSLSDLACERLTPIIIRGPRFEKGLLSSASTRTPGLVTICDIAPSVVRFFGLKPPASMVGRRIRCGRAAHPVKALVEMNSRASAQNTQIVGMRGGSVVQSAIVVIVTFCALLGVSEAKATALRWLALIPAALPLAMLYCPALYVGPLAGAVLWVGALTAGILAACRVVLRCTERALIWLCAAIVGSLVVDLLRGAPLTRSSMAGYGWIEGARYYGLGNELMGTFLGALTVGIGVLLSRSWVAGRVRGMLAAVIYAGSFAVIGAPGLGANTGGAMAAVPATATALAARRGFRPTARTLALVLVLMLLIVGALLALDAMRAGESQSHMGRAAGLAVSGDVVGLFTVFQRKLAVNVMLLGTSLWSRLLLISLVCSALLFAVGRRRFGAAYLGREKSAGALACTTAVSGAFAFNDSGVVAAACCSVFLWMLLATAALTPHNQA